MTPKTKQAHCDQRRAQSQGAGIEMLDVNAAGFKEELRRQVARLDPADEAEAMRFIEAVADFSEE